MCGAVTRLQRKFLALTLAIAAAAPVAAQPGFSWQLSGFLQQSEIGRDIESDSAAVTATRFFAPVTADGPLALSPFLARSSRVTIGVDGDEQRQTVVRSFGFPIGMTTVFTPTRERDGYTIGGRKVWRDSGWFLGGSYEGGDTELLSGLAAPPTLGEIEGYGIAVGKYLAAATSLELGLRTNDITTSFGTSTICSFLSCILETTLKTDEAALSTLHVGSAGALTYSISGAIVARESEIAYEQGPPPVSNPAPFTIGGVAALPPAGAVINVITPGPVSLSLLAADQVPIDRHYSYSVGGELFPTPRLGVGLGYIRWDGEPLLDDGYNVSTSWFFHERVAVRFAYARTTRDDVGVDFRNDDLLSVTFLGRL
jgi:hypothetical protein